MTTPLTKPSLHAQSDADPAPACAKSKTAPNAVPPPRTLESHGPTGPHRKKRSPPDRRRISAPIPRWKTGRRPRRDARMGYPARRRDGDWMTLRRVKDRPRHKTPRSQPDEKASRGGPMGRGLAPDTESDDGEANDGTGPSLDDRSDTRDDET